MALISPEFYSGPALIVGDGNFSFSACLAKSLGANMSTQIFATSLDTREDLETNPVAIENLDKLSSFPYINVLHGVDATNLHASFPDKIFDKIIFNFPHTGGKVKISKCRELLENYFMSASRHIDCTRGVVCVSLCQGQGGTPQDHVQRDYGNTWQVVQQATKAGLILHEVHPFRETDYPGYNSSGFKGKLNQQFTADRGLTYMFIHGGPQSVQSAPISHTSLFVNNGNPVARIKSKIEKFCAANNIKNIDFQRDTSSDDKEVGHLGDKMAAKLNMASTEGVSLYGNVYQLLKQQKDFVFSGTETDFSIPPSAGFYPITHYSAISKSYNLETDQEMVQCELNGTVNKLINDLCPKLHDGVSKELPNNTRSIRDDLNFPKCQLNLFKPVDYERLRQRKRNFLEWRPKEKDHFRHTCSCSLLEKDAKVAFDNGILNAEVTKSNICKLEESFFSQGNITKLSDIFEESTINRLSYDEMVFLTSGLAKGKEFEHNAWVIVVNLDYLAMVMYGVSDVRMLSSNNPLFLQQFEKETEDWIPQFIPFSLYPPIYVHDISFWLTVDSTERKFFQAIHDVTGNTVSNVYFRERYVDQLRHQVSYNYRMIYCCCDGPLSHLQTVVIQNKLRLLLLELNFQLS